MKSVKRNALRIAAATVASGVLAAGAVALAGPASASTLSPASSTGYSFQTLDNAHDLTFNQLLGINDEGLLNPRARTSTRTSLGRCRPRSPG
jgi:hypothetical protein